MARCQEHGGSRGYRPVWDGFAAQDLGSSAGNWVQCAEDGCENYVFVEEENR